MTVLVGTIARKEVISSIPAEFFRIMAENVVGPFEICFKMSKFHCSVLNF